VAERPLIAVTMGDPAGVGPEIVAGAIGLGDLHAVSRPLVVGDRATLERAAQSMGVSASINVVAQPSVGRYEAGTIDLLDLGNVPVDMATGKVQGAAGRAAFGYIERATQLAMSGAVEAIATAPLNKEALKEGNVPHLDHTGAFAALTNSPEATTMFVLDNLRIFFATRHMSLARAIADLTIPRVVAMLVHAHEQMERFGFARPHIALAALNPHGGESGMFGDEEITILAPAAEEARSRGINVTGPHPADSVFHAAIGGAYDCVMSLFHDQGHIASKTVDFDRTIAITTGLPFIRSSVDHGTAFDIAGKGIVRWLSMSEAIRVGAEFAVRLRERGAVGTPN
jgi:4-phospho-D-threonate 3-dehydrogenase / 4-phospho-D-erythronate 3-dehydrogenase